MLHVEKWLVPRGRYPPLGHFRATFYASIVKTTLRGNTCPNVSITGQDIPSTLYIEPSPHKIPEITASVWRRTAVVFLPGDLFNPFCYPEKSSGAPPRTRRKYSSERYIRGSSTSMKETRVALTEQGWKPPRELYFVANGRILRCGRYCCRILKVVYYLRILNLSMVEWLLLHLGKVSLGKTFKNGIQYYLE